MFNIKKGDIISVVGAGGKTSLLNLLTSKYSKKNCVLLTTTTKIYPPTTYDFLYHDTTFLETVSLPLKNGLYVIAPRYKDKLSSLSVEELDKLRPYFDYVFIEADGAKMKTLKGWNENEPVIYSKTTIAVGVLNFSQIGKPISNKNIHRVELFCDLVGKKIGNKISMGDFNKIKESKNGMFKGAKGRKVLYPIYPLDTFPFITPIILASGFSRRMGKNKLLLPIDGIPMIEHLFIELWKMNFKNVVVVTQYKEVEKLAVLYGFKVIRNTKPEKGISESIKLGVMNTDTESNFMFFNGDQPYLRSEIIKKIIKSSKDGIISVPTINNNRKSPVLFNSKFREELLKLKGDIGGKQVINNNLDKVVEVKFEKIRDFIDIDIVEEYEGI